MHAILLDTNIIPVYMFVQIMSKMATESDYKKCQLRSSEVNQLHFRAFRQDSYLGYILM